MAVDAGPFGRVVRVDPAGNRIEAPVRLQRDLNDPLGGHCGIAVGLGSVWVGCHRGTSVARIDPASGAIAGRVRLPWPESDVAVGEGAVWVVTRRGVARLTGP